jgi:hypothetical protein
MATLCINYNGNSMHILQSFLLPYNSNIFILGMTEFSHEDVMPEPKIVIEALRAARKINDYAAAVRFLEAMKYKCGSRTKEVWPYVMQEVSYIFV